MGLGDPKIVLSICFGLHNTNKAGILFLVVQWSRRGGEGVDSSPLSKMPRDRLEHMLNNQERLRTYDGGNLVHETTML